MATASKRKRGNISYKEPSSDEGISGASESESDHSSRPNAPARRSKRHRAPVTEDRHVESTQSKKPTATTTRSARGHARQRISYKDISTDEDEDEGEDEEDPDADFQAADDNAPQRPQPSGRGRAVASPRKPVKAVKGKSSRKLPLGAPRKPNVPHQLAERQLLCDELGRV